jgi:hypothetical protein
MTIAAKKEKKNRHLFLQQQLCRVSGNKNVLFSFENCYQHQPTVAVSIQSNIRKVHI